MRVTRPALALPFALLAALAVGACPSPPPAPPCDADGGGPLAATPQFERYLAGLPGCTVDSDCVLIETPCQQSYEDCDFTQAPVPLAVESAAEELVSKLTAENCPTSCTITEFDAIINGAAGEQCPLGFETLKPTAACHNPSRLDGGGTCVAAPFVQSDGGEGNFESFCDFACGAGNFCDIESVELPCVAHPGVFAVPTSAAGTCEPVSPDGFSCLTDADCGWDSVCEDQSTGESCCADGNCSCTCVSPCPAEQPVCPNGCVGPLNDGRHCEICECAVCP